MPGDGADRLGRWRGRDGRAGGIGHVCLGLHGKLPRENARDVRAVTELVRERVAVAREVLMLEAQIEVVPTLEMGMLPVDARIDDCPNDVLAHRGERGPCRIRLHGARRFDHERIDLEVGPHVVYGALPGFTGLDAFALGIALYQLAYLFPGELAEQILGRKPVLERVGLLEPIASSDRADLFEDPSLRVLSSGDIRLAGIFEIHVDDHLLLGGLVLVDLLQQWKGDHGALELERSEWFALLRALLPSIGRAFVSRRRGAVPLSSGAIRWFRPAAPRGGAFLLLRHVCLPESLQMSEPHCSPAAMISLRAVLRSIPPEVLRREPPLYRAECPFRRISRLNDAAGNRGT